MKTHNAGGLLALLMLAASSAPQAAEPTADHQEQGAMANPAAGYELPSLEVVATTPLPGLGLGLDHIPTNVQTLGARDLDGRGDDSLVDVMNRALGSVNINDTQGNPYQIDVNFRGFTASPVLGTPQGLSVFVDGVRVNETFGDVVNWDLIPQNAIANVVLMPGINPQFGLNTLGGALSVVTKSGFQFPGTQVTVDGGSARRRQFEFETGGHGDAVDYFIAANLYRDAGWGDSNPSDVKQLFAKTGFQDDDTDLDLSLSLADNLLRGNQTLPLSFFDNLHQIYTAPDISENKLALLNLKGSQFFGKDLLAGGNLYYRRVVTSIFNSNANGNYSQTLDSAGNPCSSDPGPFLPDCPSAQNVLNTITQNTFGMALQLSDTAEISGRENSAALGLSYDRGRTAFIQGQQLALASPTRTTYSGQPIIEQVGVDGGTDYTGLYATDTLSLQQNLVLTVSGRYNRATVNTRYAYYDPNVYSTVPEGGDYTYTRFNPAVGLNFNPSRTLSTYLSYTEGMRAPTPVELTCASPSDACALPNAFSTDPYLKMVVSRSLELGARGDLGAGGKWTAALFQTRLQDDILFIATSPVQGYFSNVGDTTRRGLELGLDQRSGHWQLGAHYTAIDATFQTPFSELSVSSTANPATGLLSVPSGSRIPGVPRQQLKLLAHYDEGDRWSVGASMQAQTATFARGDEANNDVNGAIPGYAVCNLDAHYALDPQLELSVNVHNLFNRVYSTFGALATNLFNQPGHAFDPGGVGQPEQFRSIGAPRLGYVSLTWWIDKPARGAAQRAGDRD